MVTSQECDTAIAGIKNSGQSFTLDGFTYTKGSLSSLIELRRQVRAEEQAKRGKRPMFRGFKFTGAAYSGTD